MRILTSLLLALICTGAGQRLSGRTTLPEFNEWAPKAQQGDPHAQYHLGLAYEEGNGVTKDLSAARKWFKKSADQHYGPAEDELGWFAEHGLGQKADAAEARQWYQRSADDHSVAGINNLGLFYMEGRGGPVDYAQAYRLFDRVWTYSAAARFNLGLMHELGRGRRKDLIEACAWYTVAAEKGNARGARYRDDLQRVFTPAQKQRVVKRVEALHSSLSWRQFQQFLSAEVYPFAYVAQFLFALWNFILVMRAKAWGRRKSAV